MINGVLLVDKPSGMTSHDVVNAVRKLAGTRRVGHTGTLDPLATGVMVVLLGPSTRLSQFVVTKDKRYRGVVRFGVTTDTYDAAGNVVEQTPVDITLDEIQHSIEHLRGPIEQLPPIYSAIKIDGRKMYELAREGKEIERKARSVIIHDLQIVRWQKPDLTVDVHCSSGTYIRSLAYDLGQALGCGAHLAELRRTANGIFSQQESYTLTQLEKLKAERRFTDAVLPPTRALTTMPSVTVTLEQEAAIRYGQQIPLDGFGDVALITAQDEQERLIAVLTKLETALYRPKIVLPPEES